MFDDSDHEFMMHNEDRVPDGVIDGTHYAQKFVKLASLFGDIEDDFSSHIRWIMECVNECYDPDLTGPESFSKEDAIDTVTVLSYMVMTMKTLLIRNGIHEEYVEYLNEEVVPKMVEECEAIPWYDFSEEIKKIILEQGDENNDN